MATIQFSDLVDLLPRGDHFIAKTPPRGLSYFSETNPCFVEPDLNVTRALEPGKTSVVLLSAPGAVGKSTLAAELARRSGAPLWDLSQFQVGSKTFSGTILEAYDFEATGVKKRIKNGEFLFVLDALDEALGPPNGTNIGRYPAFVAVPGRESTWSRQALLTGSKARRRS